MYWALSTIQNYVFSESVLEGQKVDHFIYTELEEFWLTLIFGANWETFQKEFSLGFLHLLYNVHLNSWCL